MPYRIVLPLFLAASCAAPASLPAQQPGEGSKAPRPDPDPADAAAAKPPRPKKDGPEAAPKGETLGQCLARKGIRLFGASWCKPCHDQLAMFGDDAKNVPYVDCFPEDGTVISVPACEAVGLDLTGSFPTWIFPDGLRVEGTRSLRWLATSSGCPAP